MSIRGIFQSHSALIGERGTELDARVLMAGYGGTAPMLALSSGMPSQKTPQVTYHWIEDEHISGNSAVTTGGNSAAVSIVVGDSNIWTTNTILMNEVTGEYLLITSIAADGVTIGIRRAMGGTTAQTITAGDTLQTIGTGFAEGTGKPDAVTQKGEERSNLVQIFKNGWSITGTAKAVQYLTGSQMAYNRQMCLAYHAEDIERAFLWGRKMLTTANNKQLRLTQGVLAQIEDYGGLVVSAASNGISGQLNLKDFLSFIRKVFDKNAKGQPNERIAFCGSQLLELVQLMVMQDGNYSIGSGEEMYGMKVTTINGVNGKLKLLTHPMMVENTKWQRELYVLHPGLISKRVLRPSWNQEFTEGSNTNAGVDADEGFIAVEMGFQVKGAQTMGIYRNIQSAGASF